MHIDIQILHLYSLALDPGEGYSVTNLSIVSEVVRKKVTLMNIIQNKQKNSVFTWIVSVQWTKYISYTVAFPG